MPTYPDLQFIVLDPITVRIRHRSLDRLGRLTHHALDLGSHTLARLLLDLLAGGLRLLGRALGFLGRGGRLLAHLLGIRHLSLLGVVGDVGVDLVLAVLLDEGGEVLDGARARVRDGVGLGAGGEEFDGGEAGDLVGNVVGGRVDFGDGHLLRVGRVVEVEGG